MRPRQRRDRQLLATVAATNISTRRLKKHERDYRAKHAQKALEEDPAARLPADNERLVQLCKRLEAENEALARQIMADKVELTQRVTLAMEAKEELQSEMQRMRLAFQSAMDIAEETANGLRAQLQEFEERYRQSVAQFDAERARLNEETEQTKRICRELNDHMKQLLNTNPTLATIAQLQEEIQEREILLAETKLKLVDSECNNESLRRTLRHLLRDVNAGAASAAASSVPRAVANAKAPAVTTPAAGDAGAAVSPTSASASAAAATATAPAATAAARKSGAATLLSRGLASFRSHLSGAAGLGRWSGSGSSGGGGGDGSGTSGADVTDHSTTAATTSNVAADVADLSHRPAAE